MMGTGVRIVDQTQLKLGPVMLVLRQQKMLVEYLPYYPHHRQMKLGGAFRMSMDPLRVLKSR
jgi:hypothetical protein